MFLAYLGGFISHHICLIFYWIFIKERKWVDVRRVKAIIFV
jgi:hypothetical protein